MGSVESHRSQRWGHWASSALVFAQRASQAGWPGADHIRTPAHLCRSASPSASPGIPPRPLVALATVAKPKSAPLTWCNRSVSTRRHTGFRLAMAECTRPGIGIFCVHVLHPCFASHAIPHHLGDTPLTHHFDAERSWGIGHTHIREGCTTVGMPTPPSSPVHRTIQFPWVGTWETLTSTCM